MALPPHKQSGTQLTAGEFNAVRDAARSGANPRVGAGLEVMAITAGVSLTLQPTAEQIENAVQCELTTDATVDVYNVVEIYQGLAGYTGPTLLQCRRPRESGFARLGITLQGGSLGSVIWIQRVGISALAYTGDTSVGNRLGGKKDDYLAQPDQGGPFLVQQIAVTPDPGAVPPVIGVALVEITGKRIDAKLVDCDAVDPNVSGPYHTIIYSGFTVTLNSPGDLTTT